MIYLILKDFKNLVTTNYTCTLLAVLLFVAANGPYTHLFSYVIYYLGFSVLIHRKLILDKRLAFILGLNTLVVASFITYFIVFEIDTVAELAPTQLHSIILSNLASVFNGYITSMAFLYIAVLSCYNTVETYTWTRKAVVAIIGVGKYYLVLVATVFSLIYSFEKHLLPIPLIMMAAWVLRYIVEKPPTKRKKKEILQHSYSA